ncbi:uncharacterized protein LOC108114659 isoform X2 [Drosophila eugracilis]|uniref:uncharacterized protein LOC108114659 isoform X2 n=1 Tax=Drosophila eugracilis TaxID=29029 RepID=UPI0007E640C6|nr:uncharacterized protein LOC108114659 isoform X2 [Drosophila eugracilis]
MSPRNERNTPWKKSDVLLLLDLYESEPVLYDNTLLLYKSQSCRQDALERIAKHFPNKTVTDIKTKIGNLRGQFSNEKIKLKRAKKTNDLTYSPYWFSKIRFLDSFLKTRSSSSTFSLFSVA